MRPPFSISRIGVTSKGSLIAFTNSYAACFGAEGGDNAAVGVANPVLSHHNVNDIIRPGFIPRCGRSPTIVGRREGSAKLPLSYGIPAIRVWHSGRTWGVEACGTLSRIQN